MSLLTDEQISLKIQGSVGNTLFLLSGENKDTIPLFYDSGYGITVSINKNIPYRIKKCSVAIPNSKEFVFGNQVVFYPTNYGDPDAYTVDELCEYLNTILYTEDIQDLTGLSIFINHDRILAIKDFKVIDKTPVFILG